MGEAGKERWWWMGAKREGAKEKTQRKHLEVLADL